MQHSHFPREQARRPCSRLALSSDNGWIKLACSQVCILAFKHRHVQVLRNLTVNRSFAAGAGPSTPELPQYAHHQRRTKNHSKWQQCNLEYIVLSKPGRLCPGFADGRASKYPLAQSVCGMLEWKGLTMPAQSDGYTLDEKPLIPLLT